MSKMLNKPAGLLALCAAVVVSACGASTVENDPNQVFVSLSPSSTQVEPRAVVPFTATVTGSTIIRVTWSVQGGDAHGTITSDGVYTAPATTGQYAVVATAVADGTTSGSATVTVSTPAAVAVTISPKTRSVAPGGSVAFSAAVTGSNNTGVTWSVQGGSANGTITSGGLYTAPGGAGTYTVMATSAADTSKSDTATVTVSTSAAVAVTISPKTRSVAPGGSVAFSAAVTGSNNTGVTWSIQGGSANGTITSGGLYTAPGGAGTYTVMATSAADTSKSDTATVTVSTGGSGLAAQLATLSGRAILFEHASVGENVMDGIGTLMASNSGAEPTMIYRSGDSGATVGAALHAGVLYGNGWNINNGDYGAKLAIFDSVMRGGAGAKANIAMAKPCYSDFGPGNVITPQQAFDKYVSTINGLKALYPNVIFIHWTSPVRSDNPDNTNWYRHQFSNLMRAQYGSSGTLFDIESIESNGFTVTVDGMPAMNATYTNDTGHLNAKGQDVVARALVALLASLP